MKESPHQRVASARSWAGLGPARTAFAARVDLFARSQAGAVHASRYAELHECLRSEGLPPRVHAVEVQQIELAQLNAQRSQRRL
jgi:hypothetical protein